MKLPFNNFTLTDHESDVFGEFMLHISLPKNWSALCRVSRVSANEWQQDAKDFIDAAIREKLARELYAEKTK